MSIDKNTSVNNPSAVNPTTTNGSSTFVSSGNAGGTADAAPVKSQVRKVEEEDKSVEWELERKKRSAMECLEQGRRDEAQSNVLAALQMIDNTPTHARERLKDVHISLLQIYATTESSIKNYKKAADIYADILVLDPNNFKALTKRAQMLLNHVSHNYFYCLYYYYYFR